MSGTCVCCWRGELAFAVASRAVTNCDVAPKIPNVCHPEAFPLREGSPAMATTSTQSTRLFGRNLELLLEEPGQRQLSPTDRGRSFAQKKRFRMTKIAQYRTSSGCSAREGDMNCSVLSCFCNTRRIVDPEALAARRVSLDAKRTRAFYLKILVLPSSNTITRSLTPAAAAAIRSRCSGSSIGS